MELSLYKLKELQNFKSILLQFAREGVDNTSHVIQRLDDHVTSRVGVSQARRVAKVRAEEERYNRLKRVKMVCPVCNKMLHVKDIGVDDVVFECLRCQKGCGYREFHMIDEVV